VGVPGYMDFDKVNVYSIKKRRIGKKKKKNKNKKNKIPSGISHSWCE